MKKLNVLISLLLIFISANSLKAQWTTSGVDIYNSNTGEVGIGTTTPAYLLDISNSTTTRALNLNSTYSGASTKYGIYSTVSDAGTSSRYGLYSTVTAASGNASLAYGLRSSVTHNGTGASYGVYSIVSGSGTGTRYGVYSSASGSSHYAFYGIGRGYFSDKVGFGITSPIGQIHVKNVEVDLTTGGSLILGPTDDVNMAFDANEIHVRNNGASTMLYLNPLGGSVSINNAGTVTDVSLSSEGAFRIGDNSSNNLIFDNNEIQARNNGDASSLTLNASGGNVYIGTFSGSEKLNVCGGIKATEIRVESGWCDYVFADDYQLRPLEEVADFIKSNQHLPNIPPAADVETNGLALGDMSKRMMEKIEELTLYLIQQDEQIQALKAANEQMQLQISQIATR